MRVYEKNFKDEAVKLSNEIGTKKAAKQLGLPVSTLAGWRTSKQEFQGNAFVGSGKKLITPGTEKLVELEKEIKELKRANEILKEALGFFAKSQKK